MSIDTYPPPGPVITLPMPVAQGGTGAVDAPTARSNIGCGSMAQQNAASVAITGGSANGLAEVGIGIADAVYPLDVTGQVRVTDACGIGRTPFSNVRVWITYVKNSGYGLIISPADQDTGNAPVEFRNLSGSTIGSIATTATTTTYNTSSDVRLKHAVAPLIGSLDVIAMLNPISHRWNADDSYAENFLAHELQCVLPYAVTGEPDAVNDDGSIQPQQVDNSKIVPRLVGAVKELLAQVEALTTRISVLETALGV